MDINEAKGILSILEIAYPKHYKTMSDADKVETVKLYYDYFSHYDLTLVIQGLKNYIGDNEYPPTIAGLHKHVKALIPKSNDAVSLWNDTLKAIRNSAYKSKEEFDALPVECRRWLGSPKQLKDLSQVDPETLNTVVRGQFLKTIPETISACELLPTPEMRFICED